MFDDIVILSHRDNGFSIYLCAIEVATLFVSIPRANQLSLVRTIQKRKLVIGVNNLLDDFTRASHQSLLKLSFEVDL